MAKYDVMLRIPIIIFKMPQGCQEMTLRDHT